MQIEKYKIEDFNQDYLKEHKQKLEFVASSCKNTDKVIVVPDGTNPVTFLGDAGRSVVQVPGR